ncbi:MAG: hypothetical protein DMF87_20785 [Acidobacteria bacterium]|nr:MAG: hypothetical protein DMF87_20785 [Acidobacteriota bacterium]
MARAIYTEAHTRLWFDAAVMLEQEIGLEPCYWIGKPSAEPEVRRLFPRAIFHSRTDAIRGVPPPELAAAPQRPLDADVLREFARVQLTVGKMMDRVDVRDGFRFEERTRLFQIQLRYWRSVIDGIRPDIVVFPVQPHTVYDYVIYELCRFYGIRTAMFQWTVFHDWIYPLPRIDDGYGEIEKRYRTLLTSGNAEVTLAPALEQYLADVRGDYREAVPDYLVQQMPGALRSALFGGTSAAGDFGLLPQAVAAAVARGTTVRFPAPSMFVSNPRRARKHVARFVTDRFHRYRRTLRSLRGSLRKTSKYAARRVELTWSRVELTLSTRVPKRGARHVQRLYRRYVRMPLRGLIAGDTNRPLKEPDRPMEESFRGRFGGLRLQVMRMEGNRRKQELLRQYHARCGTPDFTVPYIFVALHYQPEQTTSPTGSVFVDQNLMVEMLARLVPQGWRIYVKEHPFQFFPNSIGERSRTIEFYDDLGALPNVTLVPWSVSPFKLIDDAQAVATVCGTTGIETIMRGKPVLAFGYAWYRGCEGVFYTPSVAACRGAIATISNGYTVDERKVRLYLKAVEQSCFRADLDFGVHIEPIAHDENVARIAGGIRHIYGQAMDRVGAFTGKLDS